ncbi:DUF2129 domain-containing protein [Lactococcus kimchii]|uniref:YlbG family protein n=1 Tax=Lactococcus sp. S-13 TaxID=2507158 RepID=UPI001023335B|nr:YlbG family protein [Lactococcus sp. S-13]RZI49750.1 DUF2129 domain-containing protein [Lactococcus sp. S-13]
MDDIMDKKEIRPLEVPERVAIYVYCHSYKGARQLARFGDVIYTSSKSHYSLLYVEDNEVAELVKKLEELKFVKKVRVGRLKALNQDFSGAFAKTNLEVKEALEKLS